MPEIAQRSFAAGVLAPILRARTDVARYGAGAKRILNALVAKSGAFVSRGGFIYGGEVKDSTKATRVLEFAFDDIDDHYTIEMGDGYMRFWGDQGARIVTSGVAAWASGTIYAPGNLVEHDPGSGSTIYYARENSQDVEPGVDLDWEDSWYEQDGAIFEIPTPYSEAEIADVGHCQIGDYVFLVHGNHPPYELLREDHTSWTLRPMRFRPPLDGPLGVSLSITAGTGGGTRRRRVKVTAVKKGTGEESLVGATAAVLVGTLSIGSGTKLQVNVTNALANGDDVLVHRVTPKTGPPDLVLSTALVGKVFNISDRHAGDFELDGTAGLTLGGIYQVEVVPLKAPLLFGSVNGGGDACIQPNVSGHGLTDGDEVLVLAVMGLFGYVADPALVATLVGATFPVEVIDANNLKLPETEGLPVGGPMDIVLSKTWAEVTTATLNSQLDVSWSPVDDVDEYNIYKDEETGTFGLVGSSTGTSFHDAGIDPEGEFTPPRHRNPFRKPRSYPRVVGTFQQRLLLASTLDEPDICWMSRPADLRNFTQSVPLQEDDSLRFAAAGAKVQQIQHALDLRSLILLNSGSTWKASGLDGSSSISAPGPQLEPQDYSGSSRVRPVVAGVAALYVQARAQGLYQLAYSLQGDSFSARDLSAYAPHLFVDRTLNELAFARVPHPICWAVRSDGRLLGLTYELQEDVWAWHEHDTGASGKFESCCVTPQSDRDVLWVVVQRTINGLQVRNIEFLARRPELEELADLRRDYVLMDSAASYDGTNTAATTLQLALITDWLQGSTFDMAATDPIFAPGDIGNGYRLVGSDGEEVEVTVSAYVDPSHVQVIAETNVPADLQANATANWVKMVDTISGLDHLEGEAVSVLADGEVVPGRVVSGGTIILNELAGIVHVGLGFNADLELLPVDADTERGPLTMVKRRVNRVSCSVLSSRGFSAGPDAANLRDFEMADTAGSTELFTGEAPITIPARWDREGVVLIRQSRPLPLTLREVVRSVEFGASDN